MEDLRPAHPDVPEADLPIVFGELHFKEPEFSFPGSRMFELFLLPIAVFEKSPTIVGQEYPASTPRPNYSRSKRGFTLHSRPLWNSEHREGTTT